MKKFVVMKVTGRKMVEVGRFATREDAESFVEFANSTARLGCHYVVTEG